MKYFRYLVIPLLIILVGACSTPQYKETTTAVLKDKIRGGWVGKAYGVSFGGPTEFGTQGAIIEKPLAMEPDGLKWLKWQDDMYVNMALLKAVVDHGLDATVEDYAQEFAYGGFLLWHANGQGRQNILAGIPPDQSGHPKYSPHANDIDFQIECDFIGLISPGLPLAAEEMCDRAGHLMNYGDGVYGGVFVSAMYAAAFIENDIVRVVEMGLQTLPKESLYAQTIADLLKWYRQYPDDWHATWQAIEDKYNDDRCPWGVNSKFNISASINGAYIALGLLYGGGDFNKTVEISTRCGQDSDCNPANAGGVLGTMLGFDALPENVKADLSAHMEEVFEFTPYSIETATDECLRLALANVVAAGGTVTGEAVKIKVQAFTPARPVEIAFPTLTPVDRFRLNDERLIWHGDWISPPKKEEGMRRSVTPGDYMEVTFTGNAIYVQGDLRHDQGILDIILDGDVVESRDMYLPERWERADQSTAVWLTGLADGEHTLQVRVSGEKNEAGDGIQISLGRIATYTGAVAEL